MGNTGTTGGTGTTGHCTCTAMSWPTCLIAAEPCRTSHIVQTSHAIFNTDKGLCRRSCGSHGQHGRHRIHGHHRNYWRHGDHRHHRGHRLSHKHCYVVAHLPCCNRTLQGKSRCLYVTHHFRILTRVYAAGLAGITGSTGSTGFTGGTGTTGDTGAYTSTALFCPTCLVASNSRRDNHDVRTSHITFRFIKIWCHRICGTYAFATLVVVYLPVYCDASLRLALYEMSCTCVHNLLGNGLLRFMA